MGETGLVQDERVLELFFETVDEMGGLRRLVSERRLGWLPELLASAEIVVLQEQEQRRPDEIAQMLFITSDSVENVLSAPPEMASRCSTSPPPSGIGDRETAAGSLVKQAWSVVRERAR